MPMNRPALRAFASTPFDLIVVGGGITGAGIARDAVLRGLRVALFEKGDFASGTSSRTSKLIHGGIRYLEHLHFPLVFEASRERQRLLKLAPHLVRPLPFLFPVYRGDRWGKGMVKAGMLLYDVLSRFQNVRPHRMLTAGEVLRLEPELSPEGLAGAALYYDSQMNDSRLCLVNLLEARSLGALVRNYAQVTRLLKDPEDRVAGVKVLDRISSEEALIEGKVVVNAAGPWADEICRMEVPEAPPKVRRTRGSHLLLPALTRGHALAVRSRRDQRVFFVIPWEGMSLVGTTDVDARETPNEVRCPPEDLQYLLSETRRFFPQRNLTEQQVIAAFAGLRPLIHTSREPASKVSRETRIYESPGGLLSVTGGKFTTYRSIAEKVVDRVLRHLPEKKPGPCRTLTRPLLGGDLEDFEAYLDSRLRRLRHHPLVDSAQIRHLISTYGTRYTDILAAMKRDNKLARRLHPELPHTRAEVRHAVRRESALMLADVLRRRTALALGPCRTDKALLDSVLEVMTPALGWSSEEAEKQREEYLKEIL